MGKRVSLVFIMCVGLAVGTLGNEPRYVVRLAQTATMGDPEALATRLARTYGATLEAVDGPIVIVRLSPSRAALLGRDPNVESITTAAAPEKIASNGIDWNTGVTYEYDGSGNVRKIGTDTFSYDVVSRLVEAHTGGVRRQYEYDAFGNRTKCTEASGTNCQGTETISASSNRSAAMTYNAAGDVTAHAGHMYTFDEFHMLASDKYGDLTREFIYDANDQRIGMLTSAPTGSWWRWTFRDPLTGKVLREFTSKGIDGRSDWKWEKDYLWRDGLLLATIQPKVGGTGTTTYHYHLDHLGTPRRITDDADVIVGIHDYHAFGPEAAGGTDERSLSLVKYTGHERDVVDAHPDSLDYMMARYYSPALGRFLSVDPTWASADLGRPQSWNRYPYVMNNPIGYTDPTGKVLELVGSEELKRQAEQIANQSLFGQQMNVAANGNTTLISNGVQGPPTLEQAAAAANLQEVIQNLATTTVNLASNSSSVLVGDFKSATIDLADMQKLGTGPGFSAAGAFGHEVREQFQSQVMHTPDPAGAPPGYGSHLIATGVESKITGYNIGEPRPLQVFGPRDFDLSRTATRGSSSVTMILRVRDLNIQSVDRP